MIMIQIAVIEKKSDSVFSSTLAELILIRKNRCETRSVSSKFIYFLSGIIRDNVISDSIQMWMVR
jgi:hypothetical protein